MSSPLARGIDVSAWQREITWPRVAAARIHGDPIAFAFVRLSHGVTPDRYGLGNLGAARRAGLRVGAYHYLEASHDPAGQAEAFLRLLPPDVDAIPPRLPEVLDLEEGGADAGERALVWLLAVEEATGRQPMVYTSAGFADRVGLHRWPDLAAYPLWVAHWTLRPEPLIPRPWSSWMVWQHDNRLVVPGAVGTIDANLARAELLG